MGKKVEGASNSVSTCTIKTEGKMCFVRKVKSRKVEDRFDLIQSLFESAFLTSPQTD